MAPLRIIVSGMAGQFPSGGLAFDFFHYLIGLHELGHDVWYHEDTGVCPYDPVGRHVTTDPVGVVRHFTDFFQNFAPQLAGRWHYVLLRDRHFGMTRTAFDGIASSADVWLDVSGANFFPDRLNSRAVKIFLDTDPGYNQIVMAGRFAWSPNVNHWADRVNAYDRHFSYGLNIGRADCPIPTMGIRWRPTLPIVTGKPWDAIAKTPAPADAPFTTVMTLGYFAGPVTHGGKSFEAKVPELTKFLSLPRRSPVKLRLAISSNTVDLDSFHRGGFEIVDGHSATGTAGGYTGFIGQSAGEWSVAKQIYVATNSGWFSTRTACYLAAGRPAVVQETGWSSFIPTGEGLFAFETVGQAAHALNQVTENPGRHWRAAAELTREFFAADRVLPGLLEAAMSAC